MPYAIEPGRATDMAQFLLAWYDKNKRDLPWRHTKDPYAIWISEIMAQQTRIAFLTAYYQRFVKLFPTVHCLAQADTAEVLKAWEGLGYYSRARNLQKAAQEVVARFGGQLPRDKEALLSLPGIGEYTAGAILSIAYGIPTPAVDGNVLRVYSRLENADADINLPTTRRQAADFVAALLPDDRAGCFTQALMELGALVCLPKTPDCTNCPLTAVCLARRGGRQAELPRKSAKKPPRIVDKTVFILRNESGEVLMRQRAEALLSGLWELYIAEGAMEEDAARDRLVRAGFEIKNMEYIGESRHVFTHQIWQMRGFDCQVMGNVLPETTRWMAKDKIDQLPMPVALRYYLQKI